MPTCESAEGLARNKEMEKSEKDPQLVVTQLVCLHFPLYKKNVTFISCSDLVGWCDVLDFKDRKKSTPTGDP